MTDNILSASELKDGVAIAAWEAMQSSNITWIDDQHGHIAAIVTVGLVEYALRHGYGR